MSYNELLIFQKTTEAEGTSTRPTVCVTLTNTSGLLFIVFFCIIVASLISCVISCLRRKQSATDKKGSNANTISPEGIIVIQFNHAIFFKYYFYAYM